jgi:hypothetical protein
MGRATAQKLSGVAARRAEARATPREPVPPELHEGFDADAFNRKVAEYRELAHERGISAALSRYAGEPVVVCTEQDL